MANNIEFWRLKEFVSKHVWESYIVILLFGLPLLYYILSYYYPAPIEPENARNILNTLAQLQAAIIAILVSLILIAVQISSEKYSPRVIDVFKEFTGFWILIAVYGISIFTDVFAIYVVPFKAQESYIGLNVIFNLAILIAFVAFTALFPFISYTMDLLKPRNIIDKLENKIKNEKFIKNINEKYVKNETKYSILSLIDDEDQIIPLIDVTKQAIRSDDITTARDGINKLEKVLSELLDFNGNKDGIIKHFCEHLKRISVLGFTQNNEYIIIELSESLERIADKALQKEISQNAIGYIASLLGEIGKESSNRLWKKATVVALNSIGSIYINAEKSGILFTIGVPYVIRQSLDDIVSNSLNKDLYFVQFYVMRPITDICIRAIYEIPKELTDKKKILQDIEFNIAEVIGNIGQKSLENEKESIAPIVTGDVMYNLSKIGASAADVEKNLAIDDSVSLGIKNRMLRFNWPYSNEKEIFIRSGLVSPVGNLGLGYSNSLKYEQEQNLERKCEWVIDFLKAIGTLSKTKSLLQSLQSVGSFIISMGSNCIRESPTVATYAAKTLNELDIDDLVANEFWQPEFKKLYLKIKKESESNHA
jgi:hypothetical protein